MDKKETCKTIVKMWKDNTLEQIATAVNLPKQQVQNLVYAMRKHGVMLPKKTIQGWMDTAFIEELKHLV